MSRNSVSLFKCLNCWCCSAQHELAIHTGHEEKHAMKIESDALLASASHLGAKLKFSGITRLLDILRTDDPNRALICAAGHVLDNIATRYDNFRAISSSSGGKLPSLPIERINHPARSTSNFDDAGTTLRSLRREIRRLEAIECNWKPILYFARPLRTIEQALYAK